MFLLFLFRSSMIKQSEGSSSRLLIFFVFFFRQFFENSLIIGNIYYFKAWSSSSSLDNATLIISSLIFNDSYLARALNWNLSSLEPSETERILFRTSVFIILAGPYFLFTFSMKLLILRKPFLRVE